MRSWKQPINSLIVDERFGSRPCRNAYRGMIRPSDGREGLMKRLVEEENRGQTTLLPEWLDYFINEVFFIVFLKNPLGREMHIILSYTLLHLEPFFSTFSAKNFERARAKPRQSEISSGSTAAKQLLSHAHKCGKTH